MDNVELTPKEIEDFEEYHFSVWKYSCSRDDARASDGYIEAFWLWVSCCNIKNKRIEELKKELDQQRFNNKHNLPIDQKVADSIN